MAAQDKTMYRSSPLRASNNAGLNSQFTGQCALHADLNDCLVLGVEELPGALGKAKSEEPRIFLRIEKAGSPVGRVPRNRAASPCGGHRTRRRGLAIGPLGRAGSVPNGVSGRRVRTAASLWSAPLPGGTRRIPNRAFRADVEPRDPLRRRGVATGRVSSGLHAFASPCHVRSRGFRHWNGRFSGVIGDHGSFQSYR